MRTLALALACLAGPLFAADLKLDGEAEEHRFVRVNSDKPGKWLVIGPNNVLKIDKTVELAELIVGSVKLAKCETIVLEEGKQCVFVGRRGVYAVILYANDEAEPSLLAVQVEGTGPPPDPDDPPPPPPPGPNPWKDDLAKWAKTHNVTAAEATIFAEAFRQAAKRGRDGEFTSDTETASITALSKATSSKYIQGLGLNRHLELFEFRKSIVEKVQATTDKTLAAHLKTWDLIAEGFESLGGA